MFDFTTIQVKQGNVQGIVDYVGLFDEESMEAMERFALLFKGVTDTKVHISYGSLEDSNGDCQFPEEGVIYVRIARDCEDVAATVRHELTHAAQILSGSLRLLKNSKVLYLDKNGKGHVTDRSHYSHESELEYIQQHPEEYEAVASALSMAHFQRHLNHHHSRATA